MVISHMYGLRLQPNLETGQLFFFSSVKLVEKGSYTVISHMYGLRLQPNLGTGQLFFFFSKADGERLLHGDQSHVRPPAAAQPRNWTTIFFFSVKLAEKGSYTVISHMYGLRLQPNLETGQLFFFSFSKAGGERLLHGNQSHVRPPAAAQPRNWTTIFFFQ
jgi:hypothetical protein